MKQVTRSTTQFLIHKWLFLLLTTSSATSVEFMEPFCILSDCSLPDMEPLHPKCSIEHFLVTSADPLQDLQPKISSWGAVLDVATSGTTHGCIELSTEVFGDDPAFRIALNCKSNTKVLFEISFELEKTPGSGHLKCIRPVNESQSERCTVGPRNRLRLTVNPITIAVENVNLNGVRIGRMDYTINSTILATRHCNCSKFESTIERYQTCGFGEKSSIAETFNAYIAYGKAGFIALMVVVAIAFCKFVMK